MGRIVHILIDDQFRIFAKRQLRAVTKRRLEARGRAGLERILEDHGRAGVQQTDAILVDRLSLRLNLLHRPDGRKVASLGHGRMRPDHDCGANRQQRTNAFQIYISDCMGFLLVVVA